jgi:hypothetical protein
MVRGDGGTTAVGSIVVVVIASTAGGSVCRVPDTHVGTAHLRMFELPCGGNIDQPGKVRCTSTASRINKELSSFFRIVELIKGNPAPFAICYTIGNVIAIAGTCE